MRSVVVMALVLAAIAGACTSEELPPVGVSSSQGPTSTIAASTTVPASTTTLPPTVTTTLPRPERIEFVALPATEATTDPGAWVRSGTVFDRSLQYWLGVQGTDLVLFAWDWYDAGLTVQRSPDGSAWTEPVSIEGLPAGAQPFYWDFESTISMSETGMIAVFEIPSSPARVYTSSDGLVWVEEELPEYRDTAPGSYFGVGATSAGYAVGLASALGRVRGVAVRAMTGEWQTVPLPKTGNVIESWITAAQDGFLAFVADHPSAAETTHELFAVTTDGLVDIVGYPTDRPPVVWGDALVTHNPYSTVPQPSVYAGPNDRVWYRLPVPERPSESDNEYWHLDTLTAGSAGITLAGCNCGDYWGFYGNSFVDIDVDKAGYRVSVLSTGHVSVWRLNESGDGFDEPVWDMPTIFDIDSRSWFDEQGTVTVPDPEGGDPLVSVTCDEIRTAGRQQQYQAQLIERPSQHLMFSPDGTTWFQDEAPSVFGQGAYILTAATAGDTVALLVDPSGEAPTPDPPNCQLGIYPATSPFEIWTMNASPR